MHGVSERVAQGMPSAPPASTAPSSPGHPIPSNGVSVGAWLGAVWVEVSVRDPRPLC
jgi:hypothetical protein